MAVLKKLRVIERKYAWSFIGVLITVASISYSILSEYNNDKRPALQFDILSSASVLDVKEQLSNLSVLFDGIDIRKQGQSLRVISIRATNPSSKDILKAHYDDTDPIGLKISNGEVIRAELVEATNDYLRRKFEMKIAGGNKIIFPRVILEAKESLVIKLLVLHKNQEPPTLVVFGKIAGIKNILIRDAYTDDQEPFYAEAFWGTPLIQIARIVAYSIGALLIILAIIIPIVAVSEFMDSRRRKRNIKEFKGITSIELDESDEFIFTEYVEFGANRIDVMRNVISDEDRLNSVYKTYLENKDAPKDELKDSESIVLEIEDKLNERNNSDFLTRSQMNRAVRRMEQYLSSELVQVTDKGLSANEHMANTIEHFHRFLRNRGLISSKSGSAMAIAKELILIPKKFDSLMTC